MADSELKRNLKSTPFWLRGLFMIGFLVIFSIVDIVLWVLTIIQFIFVLVTGSPNEQLTQLGSSLSTFVANIINYVSYNTEEKPFPFAPWPQPELVSEAPIQESSVSNTDEASKSDVTASTKSDEQQKNTDPVEQATSTPPKQAESSKKLNGDKLDSTEAMLKPKSKSKSKPDTDMGAKAE